MLTRATHAARAQVLPLWIVGILAMFSLLFFVLDTGEALRWQIRAQNAADAASSAAVSVQAQRFNQIEVQLYVLSLEEYRAKRLVDDLEVVANGSGGCWEVGGQAFTAGQLPCSLVYDGLHRELAKSLNRYTNEIGQFAQLTAAASASNVQSDARAVVATLGSSANCNTAAGGDCNFAYTVFDQGVYGMWGLHNAYMDSKYIRRSGCCDGEAPAMQPIDVEVVVCHQYVPIISRFFGLDTGTRRVVARGSYADVVVDSEWFQPGNLINPLTSKPFQAPEHFGLNASYDGLGGRYDWYGNQFGGASWTADTANNQYVANGPSALGESDRYMQWWGPMTSYPQSGMVLSGLDQVPCK